MSKNYCTLAALIVGMALYSNSYAQYTPQTKSTGCCCKIATVLLFTGTDYSQTTAFQDLLWVSFKATYSGITDNDRAGNATYTYNCHSYIVNGEDRWLNWGQVPNFVARTATPGCWQRDPDNGYAKLGSAHSCGDSNNLGKCGASFKCCNNQYVYGLDMPTEKYKLN